MLLLSVLIAPFDMDFLNGFQLRFDAQSSIIVKSVDIIVG